jgi:hypothetical protein
MMKRFFRFVVCVDIPADNLRQAYNGLLDRMNANDWESTDEVYDLEGDAVKPSIFQTTRELVLLNRNA